MPRPHWTEVLGRGSLSDAFERRTGVDSHKDVRVRAAAHPLWQPGQPGHPDYPAYQPPPVRPRRPGRPTHDLFNACAVATTDLVGELQGNPRRHDWQAVTIAMMWPGEWGPRGLHGRPWKRGADGTYRLAVEDLRDRIKDAYYRLRKRGRRARIKPRRRGIKPRPARIKPPSR